MNDPHVKALIYRLRHDDNCDYKNAPPVELGEHRAFTIKIDKLDSQKPETDTFVRFEMKDHYAYEDEARAISGPFIEAWELKALLESGPKQFWLEYNRAEIIDRKPSPGVVTAVGASLGLSWGIAKILVSRASYPSPPTNFAVDDPVRNMALHYRRFKQGREPLGAMAAFCLTALEGAAGNRAAATKIYGISMKVLNKLGLLVEEAGGEDARKYKGASRSFTPEERKWITELIPALISRAAEVAHDPELNREQITKADLPSVASSTS